MNRRVRVFLCGVRCVGFANSVCACVCVGRYHGSTKGGVKLLIYLLQSSTSALVKESCLTSLAALIYEGTVFYCLSQAYRL